MGATSIEWADYTFNPWIGCTKVSAGCANCYAETYGRRFGAEWGPGGVRRRTSPAYWRQPLRWNEQAMREGVRRRVFCASLADVFEDRFELLAWRFDLFALISETPHLDWLILTKRPRQARLLLSNPMWWANVEGAAQAREFARTGVDPSDWLAVHGPLPNIWLGTSIEDQATAAERIPHLFAAPAAVRFVSVEPMLGHVDLTIYEARPGASPSWLRQLDWVICGGESGPHARPLHPDWARSLRDQCQAAGAAFFFKQWGTWCPADQNESLDEDTWRGLDCAGDLDGVLCGPTASASGQRYLKVGKRAAGRLLDGREWNEVPR